MVRSRSFGKPHALRGLRRRLRWLKGWSESFAGYFPSPEILRHAYWNWKIPVHINMVEGRGSRQSIRRRCAQLLVDAAGNLARNRPDWAKHCRIICHIGVPDMFGSEICIYIDDEYYRRQILAAGPGESKERLAGKSLARSWDLVLPKGFGEMGLRVAIQDEDGGYRSDWWLIGEVAV